MTDADTPQLLEAQATLAALRDAVGEIIVGQTEIIDQVIWALLAGGHVLLEGNPGLGKTLLVRTLARALDLSFSRIQFTPDLMPSDVTGTHVLVLDAQGRSTGRFELHRGPVFGQLLLADEINRATPKTQSALLEAMQEHAVTLSGRRYALEEPFVVLATENPIEMEGTYPLPEAQLDRFLLKVLVPTPGEDDIVAILSRTTGSAVHMPEPVVRAGTLIELQNLCRQVLIPEPLLRYAARLVVASSPGGPGAPGIVGKAVRIGAGVRAAQSLVVAAKARCLLQGRPNVAFEDIRAVALPVLRHRIIRSFEGESDGISTDEIVRALLEHVPMQTGTVREALHET